MIMSTVERMTDREALDRAADLVLAADAVLDGAIMSDAEDGLELTAVAGHVTWAEEFLLAADADPREPADVVTGSVSEAARRARDLLREADEVLAPLMSDDDVFSARVRVQSAVWELRGWD